MFEPVHLNPPVLPNDDRLQRGVTNVQGVKARKTTFSNFAEVEMTIRKRFPWKLWDKRVQDAYLEYGFIVDEQDGTVTTCCTRAQEVWSYEPYVYVLCGHLYPKLCASFNVHVVFGERREMYSEDVKEAFSDGLEGRSPSTAYTLPKSGHLLVQEKPRECAEIINSIISTGKPITKSLL